MSFDRPQPDTSPRIVSPSRTASDARLRTTTPAPSPTMSPSAARSNGAHRPDADNARNWANPICVYCGSAPLAPPAIMASARP